MDTQKEIDKGFQAEQLLDNKIYQEATSSVRAAIMETWAGSPLRDKEGAHELRLMLHCLNAIEQHIKTVAETGKMARIQLEANKGLKSRIMGLVA